MSRLAPTVTEASSVDDHKNCAMASTSEYADLKAAVRTQKEQAAAIATAVRDAEERVALAELEVVRAQEETQREKSAREKAEAELTALHRQHRQHRRMAARSTEDVRAEADASAAERITEAAAAHASELATLRAAALQDVQDARAEGEAALATLRAAQTQEAAGWKAERDALRAAARDERRQHAARLREVIESEEATQLQCEGLLERLQAGAQALVAVGWRKSRAERAAAEFAVHAATLAAELAEADDELDAAADDRAADADDHADALAHAEAELDALRAQCRRAQRDERARRKEVVAEVEERARDAIAAAADARTAEKAKFDREIGDLRMELESARRQQRDFEAAMAAESAALLDAAFGEADASFDVVVGQSRGQLRDRALDLDWE